LYWEVQRNAYRTADLVRFVRDLRRQLGTKLLIVWDNLRGHHAAAKRFRGKGVLFRYLPPYAPDLCPVEAVWGHTKGTALANWAPEDTDELEDAVHDHLADLNHSPTLLQSFFAAAGLRLQKPLRNKGRA
jgi:transposase